MPKPTTRKSPLDECNEVRAQLDAAYKQHRDAVSKLGRDAGDAVTKVVAEHTRQAGIIGRDCEVARAQAAAERDKAVKDASVHYDVAVRMAQSVRDKAAAAAQKTYETERDNLSAQNSNLCLPIEQSLKATRAVVAAKFDVDQHALVEAYEAAAAPLRAKIATMEMAMANAKARAAAAQLWVTPETSHTLLAR